MNSPLMNLNLDLEITFLIYLGETKHISKNLFKIIYTHIFIYIYTLEPKLRRRFSIII